MLSESAGARSDADIDALMTRTARRPVPMGRVQPGEALAFGLTLAAFAVVVLGLLVNVLAAALLAFTIFFTGFFEVFFAAISITSGFAAGFLRVFFTDSITFA